MTRWVSMMLLLGLGGRAGSGNHLVVHNYYYAKPGLADSVYRTRLEASAVRQGLGLVVGRVLRRRSGPDSLPDVIWEADYPDSIARERDVRALDRSPEFDRIQQRMQSLLARFERATWVAEDR